MATIIGRNRNKKAKKSFKDMTVAEIKKQLDELGIEYDKSATKADLLTLLPQKG